MVTIVIISTCLFPLTFPNLKVRLAFVGDFSHEDADMTIWSPTSYISRISFYHEKDSAQDWDLAPHRSENPSRNCSSRPPFKPLTLQIPKYLWYSSETGSQHLPFGIQVGRETKKTF